MSVLICAVETFFFMTATAKLPNPFFFADDMVNAEGARVRQT